MSWIDAGPGGGASSSSDRKEPPGLLATLRTALRCIVRIQCKDRYETLFVVHDEDKTPRRTPVSKLSGSAIL